MILSNDIRPGTTIEYRDAVWQVVEAMHVKPGKGAAFVQSKLRNVESGDVLAVTFRAGERLSAANLEKIIAIYLYRDGSRLILVDSGGTESIELEAKDFGRNIDLLIAGQGDILVLKHRERIIRVDLPITVDIGVKETPPGERGNTSSGGGKQATLETGAVIAVPFHVKVGDRIRVDTRTREYLARVNA